MWLDFFDVLGADADGGAAKESEADGEGVGAVRCAADFALEAPEAAAYDADIVMDIECCRLKFYGDIGLPEHELEFFYFCI